MDFQSVCRGDGGCVCVGGCDWQDGTCKLGVWCVYVAGGGGPKERDLILPVRKQRK